MWLITQHGFYSLVRDRENATRFLIRARVRKDLLNLKSLAGLEAEVSSSPEREYPFRLKIDERELPRIMNALGNTVDYPSFTARIAQRIDQACRTLLYGEVLDTLRAIYDPAQPAQLRRPTPAAPEGEPAPSGGPSPEKEPKNVPAAQKKSSHKPQTSTASECFGELPLTSEPPPAMPRRSRPLNLPARLVRV